MMGYILRSESLSEFAPAFIKAQSEFTTVGKNKDGRFKYADLDAIMTMAKPILIKNGFFITHSTYYSDEKTFLHTTIMHISDQWIKSIAPILIPEDARELQQEFGKAKTYQERYAIKSILGITVADDPLDNDGYSKIVNSPDREISEGQVKFINSLILGKADKEEKLKEHYKVKSIRELTSKQASEAIKQLTK